MKERPITFTGEMVKAILDRRKTQTRRVIKISNPDEWELAEVFMDKTDLAKPHARFRYAFPTACAGNNWQTMPWEWITSPYGCPGDLLWVREPHWKVPGVDLGYIHYDATPLIAASRQHAETPRPLTSFYTFDNDKKMLSSLVEDGYKKLPGFLMPKWASRIKLEVTAVRVERVQDISESDARNEGVHNDMDVLWLSKDDTPAGMFGNLWDSINAKRGYSWDTNPWVWVVEFQRIENVRVRG